MPKQYANVTLPNTEVRTLSSSIIDQEFSIFIAKPRDYSSTKTAYPTLYVLDASGGFGMVTETVRLLKTPQEAPEMLVIGIAYPVDAVQIPSLRVRDYTPTTDDEFIRKSLEDASEFAKESLEFKGSGGAGNFLKFIHEELIPFIHSNYRADPEDSALAGHSFGGLFALYTLFHQPNIFNRYVIASPSIWWDNKVTFTFEANYAAKHADLPAKVFMSIGSLESTAMVTNMQLLAKKMEDRAYESLELKTHVFEDETHSSVIPAAISRGLRTVFAE